MIGWGAGEPGMARVGQAKCQKGAERFVAMLRDRTKTLAGVADLKLQSHRAWVQFVALSLTLWLTLDKLPRVFALSPYLQNGVNHP